ncbi:ABC transporter permease [Actinophytocola oryzae]|uniref:Peptide/nickel transport system permease protein n=1 Tax=Actinophytocola oryzae TaxID=502181 RepID=A0A4R7W430_9PSEU|nr:ABC transporter permease [Actinophytocola oryzae]TDV56377.1 peptide/nickel transport system permease protein [Actinophytocola oryzae]
MAEIAIRVPASATRAHRVRKPGRAQIIVGLVLVVPVVLVAILAPLLAPHDPNAIDLIHRLTPPAWQSGGTSDHVLGTDHLGRDMLSRVIYGARISLLVGGFAVLGAGIIGVAIGLLAGYFRGAFDAIVMMIAEIQQSFPFLALAIVVVAAIGRGVGNIVAVLVIGGWIMFARVVRGEAMSVSRRPFVDGARALGASHARIILRYVLPNVRSSIIVITTFNFAWFIIAEASLSFLGLGVDPNTPSWGQMLSDSRNYLALAWWYPAFPGIALVALVLGANMLGDGLQDHWDPYLK